MPFQRTKLDYWCQLCLFELTVCLAILKINIWEEKVDKPFFPDPEYINNIYKKMFVVPFFITRAETKYKQQRETKGTLYHHIAFHILKL